MNNFFKKLNTGFTLVELLVVISIIGVLALLVIPNLVGVRDRADDASIKNGLVEAKKALRLYYNDNQAYPATGALAIVGAEFSAASGTVYMKEMPTYTTYAASTDGERFIIVEALENAGDSDIAASQTRCATSMAAVNPSYTAGATDFVVCED